MAEHPEIYPLMETIQTNQELTLVSLHTKPVDLSDTIAEISLEIQRLGWSVEKVRMFLSEQFNRRSRSQLTDEELYQFLERLQKL
jgi:hypothetical protein